MKKPTAILMADAHICDAVPICRTDNFIDALWAKIAFISELQEKYHCPIFDAGDIYDRWRPSLSLLANCVRKMPDKFYTVAGNHDLPSHNINNLHKSGLGLLHTIGTVNMLDLHKPLKLKFSKQEIHVYGVAYGQEPTRRRLENKGVLNVLVFHTDIYVGKKPWPGCQFPKAKSLMNKYSKFDLIVTGHNHQPFTVENEGQLLVNPGSMMRRTADQMNHKPRVYLWFAGDNTVKPIYLPIEKGVVSREHIDTIETRNERIDAFVARLKQDFETCLSFEENMKQTLSSNKIKKPVKELILNAMESDL